MSDTITTERLILRPVCTGDAKDMTAFAGDLDVSRWLTHVPHPYSTSDAEAFIARIQDDFPNYAAIEIEGKFAGVISLNRGLGYWIGAPFWGRGIVLEAAEAMLAGYFADDDAADLRSGYILGNNRSRKILEILGFSNDRIELVTPLSTDVEIKVQKMILSRARWAAMG